jgi:hypothetical protein
VQKENEEKDAKKPEFETDMMMDSVENLTLDGPYPKLSPNPNPNLTQDWSKASTIRNVR